MSENYRRRAAKPLSPAWSLAGFFGPPAAYHDGELL